MKENNTVENFFDQKLQFTYLKAFNKGLKKIGVIFAFLDLYMDPDSGYTDSGSGNY
jgi:hypothetical protein